MLQLDKSKERYFIFFPELQKSPLFLLEILWDTEILGDMWKYRT